MVPLNGQPARIFVLRRKFFAACQGRQYELFGQNPAFSAVVGRAAAASLMCTKYCMSITSRLWMPR